MEHVIFAPIFPIFLWPQCHPWAIRHGPRLSRHWLQRSWWPLCRSSWGATAWSGTPGSGDDPDAGKTMPFLPPMTGNGLLYVYIYIIYIYIPSMVKLGMVYDYFTHSKKLINTGYY